VAPSGKPRTYILKLNIFRIPAAEVEAMKSTLTARGMDIIKQVSQEGWSGSFYYSSNPLPGPIPWAETFESYFDDNSLPKNRNYYAAFVFERGDDCYVLSYGKSHFYLRPYSDFDFGIELAKRIADEDDIKQTASKRFQGRMKKDIKSYTRNTRLDIESGESVDYLQSAIVESHGTTFGKSGKFGTSALLSVDREPSELGDFLTRLHDVMSEPPRFKLPRTTAVTDESEIVKYDRLLIDALRSEIGTTDFAQNSYDLYGVDFVFSSDGTFTVRCPGKPDADFDELKIREVKQYIISNSLADEDILKLRVRHSQEDRPTYTNNLKETIDFIVDDERVILSGGKWMRFNQDYLDFLDEYVREIRVEEVEPEFAEVALSEPDFNCCAEIRAAGYETADKNFDILRTSASVPIEAWDLKREKTVYAVKFATAQKLGYVCDQATNVLELLRNSAGVKQIPEFSSYCLWLGYRAKNRLENISGSGSIILKQKIEAWARKCRDLGIEPVIKISHKTN
jgi:uncharacterized protein (TIGR04141 family)